MDVAAFVVALLAVGVSVASVIYARRAAHAAEQEAKTAAAAERRANEPVLVVEIEEQVDESANSAIYSIRNDGPNDLDRLAVHRPRPSDGIRYPIAPVGQDWCEDEAELGPVAMGHAVRFVLSIGSREELPEFRVRVVSERGADRWERAVLLDPPRARPLLIV